MAREKPGLIDISVTKTTDPKCPRCYRHTPEGRFNYDSLCDRCCDVLISHFPDHWSVPNIKDVRAKQAI